MAPRVLQSHVLVSACTNRRVSEAFVGLMDDVVSSHYKCACF